MGGKVHFLWFTHTFWYSVNIFLPHPSLLNINVYRGTQYLALVFFMNFVWMTVFRHGQLSVLIVGIPKTVFTLFCFYFVQFLINGFSISLKKASYNYFYAVNSQDNFFFQSQENCASLLNLSYAKCGLFLNKTVTN